MAGGTIGFVSGDAGVGVRKEADLKQSSGEL